MRMISLSFAVLGLLAIGPVAAAPHAEPTVRQVMLGLTMPASDTLFQVEEPEYDADLYWESVEAAALMLAKSGEMLQQQALAHDDGEWMIQSQKLVETSLKAAEMARTHNVDAVFEAGFAVYDTCDACHRQYLPQPDVQ